MRNFRIFTLLALALACAAPALQSSPWWWPFGDTEEWARTPPAVQDSQAVVYMERAQAAQQGGNLGAALSNYEVVTKRYPGSRYAPEAYFQIGLIQKQRMKWRKSFEAFQRIVTTYPDFPQFTDVVAHQFDVATALAEGLNTKLFFLIPYKNYDRSIEYYEQIVRNAPYSDYAPLALMNVANIERFRQKQPEAIDALDRVINNYPESLLAPDAYLNLADTFASLVDGPYYDQGATREAMSYYQDFLILFPSSSLVGRSETGLNNMQEVYAESKYILGHYYYKYRKYYPGAKVFLNETITVAPNSQAAEKARALLAEIAEIEASMPPPPPPGEAKPQGKGFWGMLAFWRGERMQDDKAVLVTEDEAKGKVAPKPARRWYSSLLFWRDDEEEAKELAIEAAEEVGGKLPAEVVEEQQSTEKKSFWRRLKFWGGDDDAVDTDSDQEADIAPEPVPAPAPKKQKAEKAAPAYVSPTEAGFQPVPVQPEPVDEKPKKSIWRKLKFWGNDEGEETPKAEKPAAPEKVDTKAKTEKKVEASQPKPAPEKKPEPQPAPKPAEPKVVPVPRYISPEEAGFKPVDPAEQPKFVSPEEAGFKPVEPEGEKKSFFKKLKFW